MKNSSSSGFYLPFVTAKKGICVRRRKPQLRRRKFKASSSRRLSSSDLTVLDFLWTWKVATTPILKEVAYRKKTSWWIYKSLRRLRKEKYIQLLPRGKNLEQELWTLTDHGFEIVLMDRDDIKEYRYRVHAPAHDYLGTCLQMGDLWQQPFDKNFLTEQMLTSLAPSNFPKGYRPEEGSHVPDGLTIVPGALKEVVIGYEVDLNLKNPDRYNLTSDYYDYHVRAHLVVWLVKNMWIANKIIEQLVERAGRNSSEAILKRFAFVLVDDFKKKVWGAEVVIGPLKGQSIRKMHANLLQSIGKDTSKMGQKEMRDIFFPKFRSPQKAMLYEKQAEVRID